jgi:hypothetical protein
MPNKMRNPDDFENRMIRPEDYEHRDLYAQRIDFKPERQTDQESNHGNWRPVQNEQPLTRRDTIRVDRVSFIDDSPAYAQPQRNKTTSSKQVNPPSHSRELLDKAIEGEYSYGRRGQILGLAAIVGGIILALFGAAGSTTWMAKVIGFESKLIGASPGVVLFVVGIFLVRFTKPKVDLKDLKG